jgi:hypothetical protein
MHLERRPKGTQTADRGTSTDKARDDRRKHRRTEALRMRGGETMVIDGQNWFVVG